LNAGVLEVNVIDNSLGAPQSGTGTYDNCHHADAARRLEVEAIDTVFVDYKNLEGCRRNSGAARFDGFTGKFSPL
jgi:citrate lyase beta subunit